MPIYANLKKILSISASLSIYGTIYVLLLFETAYRSLTYCTNTSDTYAGYVKVK